MAGDQRRRNCLVRVAYKDTLYMLFALNSEGKKIYISDCVCFNWTIIRFKELMACPMSFNVVYQKLIKVQNPSFRRINDVLWEMEYINNLLLSKIFHLRIQQSMVLICPSSGLIWRQNMLTALSLRTNYIPTLQSLVGFVWTKAQIKISSVFSEFVEVSNFIHNFHV